MRTLTLLYHDVVPAGRYVLSGFQSPDADIYKLHCDEFRRHLEAISRVLVCPPVLASDLIAGSCREPAFLLTFDDGGVSASIHVAEMLAERGWAAHFFVTTDYIGTRGFLDAPQIRQLRKQGHVIGSHSCSHPLRMSHCTDGELEHEWSHSREVLADLLGESIETASIPGGYYTRRVAAAAARSGFRVLFNSEPVTRRQMVDGCMVIGRFAVQRGEGPEWPAAVAAGACWPRFQRYLYWNSKKLLKWIGGEYWIRMRASLLKRRGLSAK